MLKAISLFVFLFVSFVHAQSPLILANSHSWAPLSFSEGGDDPDGLLIEFWELYSTYTGREVEFELRNWGESIELVRNGGANVHAGLLKSPQRQQFLMFSDPIFPLMTGLFVRSQTRQDIMVIGVVSDSFEAEYIQSRKANMQLKFFPNNEDMIRAAYKGDVTGFVADYPTGRYFIDELGGEDLIIFSEFLYSKPIHAAVRLEDASLIDQINEGIKRIPQDELDELLLRWRIIPASEKRSIVPLVFGVLLILVALFFIYGYRSVKR